MLISLLIIKGLSGSSGTRRSGKRRRESSRRSRINKRSSLDFDSYFSFFVNTSFANIFYEDDKIKNNVLDD